MAGIHGGRLRAIASLLLVIAWGGTLAAIELPPAPRRHSPLVEAQTHLRHAREFTKAAHALASKGDCHATDGYYAACEAAWNAIWACPGAAEVLPEAGELYNESLAGLLESAQVSGRLTPEGMWIGPKWKPICVPVIGKALPIDACEIESIEVFCPPPDRRITRQHVRSGLGVPVVVRAKRGPQGSLGARFAASRQSLAATAVLRFDMPGNENVFEKLAGPLARDHAAAVLDLANPVEIAAVHVGPARPHLAADLTMPLLDMLAAMPKDSLRSFIQPYGGADTEPRLEFLEPHQPGRIPIVFIHGLASDQGTWFDMLNELRVWPTFHRRFEPWVFHYPTGAAFMTSAAVLRRELRAAVHQLDPSGTDPHLQNLVLVGHSMGGLHAKLQVVDSGTAIWDAVARRPFHEISMRPERHDFVRNAFFFEPSPFIKRVVYIATPHRGSGLASRGVGRLASLTVQPPVGPTEVHDEVVAMNPDAFWPYFAKRLPTTIDVLEPTAPLLRAMQTLRTPCWVTTHSIIGTSHHSLLVGDDDCVVPVASARIEGVSSERLIPASHTKIHHHPDTVGELKRILTLHLHESGLGEAASGPSVDAKAAPMRYDASNAASS
ncbi:MAG: esterase/lipase family protein [Planctomycetia bacterium]